MPLRILICLLPALVVWVTCPLRRVAAAERPNFVFLLVDDLGWADLQAYGSTFHETPNLDRLASMGTRFMQGYAACPVCSPTRASIMTGRHPVRVDITDWIPGMRTKPSAMPRFEHVDDRDNLALTEVTIAEQLRQAADYQTYFLGKWHLGDEGHWPTDQGFDRNIGGNHKGSPPGGYYAPWTNPTLQANSDDEYLTTRLTDEATALIRQQGEGAASPFFLMLSYYNVHTPITADKRTITHFRDKAQQQFADETPIATERSSISRLRQDNPDYASMVRAVDISVGEILDTLDEAGLQQDTVIIFFSDNGGLCTMPRRRQIAPTSNLPLRSGKGWLYEGGIREPMIVVAPGVTKPGTTSDAVVCSTDFFPTMLELADLPAQPNLHTDGVSIVDQLRGQTGNPNRRLHWHYPHYHGSGWTPGAAIRSGDWKLIEFYETDEVELYNLANDSGETKNLADSKPEVRDRLRRELAEWQADMNVKMPVPR